MSAACMEDLLRPVFLMMTHMLWYLVYRISKLHWVPHMAGAAVMLSTIKNIPRGQREESHELRPASQNLCLVVRSQRMWEECGKPPPNTHCSSVDSNSLLLISTCDVDMVFYGKFLPDFPVPVSILSSLVLSFRRHSGSKCFLNRHKKGNT